MRGDARPRVLCVDDEPQVLGGLRATLGKRFDVSTADNAADGLRTVIDEDPFIVVVADFLMPGMNGPEFLAQVRVASPDTIRILLTGHASLDNASEAINRGHIYRFLVKPCDPTDLVAALDDAVEQYRLVTADRAFVERKLASMSDRLVRAERLASLGTMAGAVGHELNNLLMTLQAAAMDVREAIEDEHAPSRIALDRIERVSSHLTLHAQNLLHFGRPAHGSTTRVDLRQALTDIVLLLRQAGVLKRADVRLDLPPDPVVVAVGGAEVEQVFVNLLKNAAEALADAPEADPTVRIAIRAGSKPGTASCTVADSAGGIPPASLPLIFEPYYTTKPADRGTGLGLFVVHQIAHRAGGEVAVESVEDRGTTFTVTLPLA